MENPKYSIVYPTRNRPDLLRECIKAVLLQETKDWELIISDNHVEKSALDIFNEFSDDHRIKYFWTGGNLSMADNFTFGLSKSSGKYVTVLTDKTTLIPTCLKFCDSLLAKEEYDLINWSEAHFYPNSSNNISQSDGSIRIVYQTNQLIEYSPKAEIDYLLQFNKHRSHDMPHYFRGKILFGIVRRELIEDLVNKNEFFLKYAPDYTTRMIVFSRAKKAIEITRPLQCAYISGDSNGMLCAIYPDKAFTFFNESDHFQNVNEYFPIKGLYTSQQNHVAGDYIYSLSKLNILPNINYQNLYQTIFFDLLKVKWNQPQIKKQQMELFYNSFQNFGITFKIHFYIISLPYSIFLYLRYRINQIRSKIYRESNNVLLKSLLKYNEVEASFYNIHDANQTLSNQFKIPLISKI